MKRLILLLAALALLLARSAQAHASVIAYDNFAAAPPGGIQNWQGNLGLDFTVNTAVLVTALGAFDDGNPANLLGSNPNIGGVTVGIFDLSTSTLVGPAVVITPLNFAAQINGDAFLPVAPFALAPGDYTVVSFNDANYNSGFTNQTAATLNDGGGAINFNVPTALSRYDSGATFDLPPTGGGASGIANYLPVPRFDAGTFEFNTPEPSSLVAMCSSLVACGVWVPMVRRRKRSAAKTV
jgi:hypothetical protein